MKRKKSRSSASVQTVARKPRPAARSRAGAANAPARRGSTMPAVARGFDGIRLATVVALQESGLVMILLPIDAEESSIVPARATVTLRAEDIGREAAVMFEKGDPELPVVIGLIDAIGSHGPGLVAIGAGAAARESVLEIDVQRLVFNAAREVVLRCGEASITLTRTGKVLIRGAQVLSRATGVNRIKGGSVQIN